MMSMHEKQQRIEATLRAAPVVAIVVIDEIAHAVPLARALVAGGIRAIEVTLRTPIALDAIKAMANEVEGAIVGAGTLLKASDFSDAERAGATFAVSPGATDRLLDAADACGLPYLPGAATASEMMHLLGRGYRFQKFFPASYAGGVEFLRSLASPLPNIRVCPTGGISAATASGWLELPNVICIGGSWMCASNLLRGGDWKKIEELARIASGFSRANV